MLSLGPGVRAALASLGFRLSAPTILHGTAADEGHRASAEVPPPRPKNSGVQATGVDWLVRLPRQGVGACGDWKVGAASGEPSPGPALGWSPLLRKHGLRSSSSPHCRPHVHTQAAHGPSVRRWRGRRTVRWPNGVSWPAPPGAGVGLSLPGAKRRESTWCVQRLTCFYSCQLSRSSSATACAAWVRRRASAKPVSSPSRRPCASSCCVRAPRGSPRVAAWKLSRARPPRLAPLPPGSPGVRAA